MMAAGAETGGGDDKAAGGGDDKAAGGGVPHPALSANPAALHVALEMSGPRLPPALSTPPP